MVGVLEGRQFGASFSDLIPTTETSPAQRHALPDTLNSQL
jgi:hypothetical protein